MDTEARRGWIDGIDLTADAPPPPYDTGRELFALFRANMLLPEVPTADPLSGGIPDAALLGETAKALAYAADEFRGAAAMHRLSRHVDALETIVKERGDV